MAVHSTTPNPKRNAAYDVDGRDARLATVSAKKPRPQNKPFWESGQDVYANDGEPSQDFLENPSTTPDAG